MHYYVNIVLESAHGNSPSYAKVSTVDSMSLSFHSGGTGPSPGACLPPMTGDFSCRLEFLGIFVPRDS